MSFPYTLRTPRISETIKKIASGLTNYSFVGRYTIVTVGRERTGRRRIGQQMTGQKRIGHQRTGWRKNGSPKNGRSKNGLPRMGSEKKTPREAPTVYRGLGVVFLLFSPRIALELQLWLLGRIYLLLNRQSWSSILPRCNLSLPCVTTNLGWVF